VIAYVRFDRGAIARLEAVRATGAEIIDSSRRYQTATVAARPSELRGLASVPGVTGVIEALTPVLAAPCTHRYGSVLSQGVQRLNAGEGSEEAGGKFSVDGEGVTVGILSDSFDQATEAADGSGPVATTAAKDVESADLPGIGNPCVDISPVTVLEPEESEAEAVPTDEGRAMAQIVHDIAPGATIDFASAFNGEEAFAGNIEELAALGAEVIADDVFYFEEPFFQDGPVAVAVEKAVTGGATYFSAAGNDNLIAEGHDIASWETPEFRDAGSCPPEVQVVTGTSHANCLDFNPGAQTDRTFGIRVEPGGILALDLQWDEPWFGVGTDLDAYLLNANGNLIAASEEDNVNKSKTPLEVISWENESPSTRVVQLVVNRFTGGDPRLKFGLLENGSGVESTEYPRSTGEDVVGPTIFGHSGAASAIAVSAAHFGVPDPSLEPEEYSSRGPVRHDFGPVKGTEAAAELSEPELISKPDLEATDCGATTFFARLLGAEWRFCGTSAATPHAAGVAALMLDSKAATPAEIRTAILASAESSSGFDPCAVGAGLVEAVGAIEDLASPPSFTPPTCATPVSEEPSGENSRAPGNWGLEAPPPTPVAVAPQPPVNPITEQRRIAPQTFIRQRPPKLIRTRSRRAKAVFRFGSNEAGVTFACRIDSGLFRPCPERLVRRFPAGWHSVRVVALDATGEGDRTPAFYRFRVKHLG